MKYDGSCAMCGNPTPKAPRGSRKYCSIKCEKDFQESEKDEIEPWCLVHEIEHSLHGVRFVECPKCRTKYFFDPRYLGSGKVRCPNSGSSQSYWNGTTSTSHGCDEMLDIEELMGA